MVGQFDKNLSRSHFLCQGDSFSYCANPNGAKTDWCPTELNDDGSYSSDKGFSWCTPGPVYEACKVAKAAAMKPCPCASSWKFKGEEYSFCADTNIGFEWCATETDSAGNYVEGKYAKCKTDVREQCEEAAEEEEAALAADTSGCPCISGGQWSFEGERQSYCQQPNGVGKRPWCPKSEASVTTSNFASVDVAYCSKKVLKKCQLLEGTRLPPQCPCVDSLWKYKGKKYSYCEVSWLATNPLQCNHPFVFLEHQLLSNRGGSQAKTRRWLRQVQGQEYEERLSRLARVDHQLRARGQVREVHADQHGLSLLV